MSEGITTAIACRRRHSRHSFPADAGATVEFGYPEPMSARVSMQLKDISVSGLSFVVDKELPGLELGRTLDGATITFRDQVIEADLLVMHLTPDASPGSVCGALIYPVDDEGILKLQALAKVDPFSS